MPGVSVPMADAASFTSMTWPSDLGNTTVSPPDIAQSPDYRPGLLSNQHVFAIVLGSVFALFLSYYLYQVWRSLYSCYTTCQWEYENFVQSLAYSRCTDRSAGCRRCVCWALCCRWFKVERRFNVSDPFNEAHEVNQTQSTAGGRSMLDRLADHLDWSVYIDKSQLFESDTSAQPTPGRRRSFAGKVADLLNRSRPSDSFRIASSRNRSYRIKRSRRVKQINRRYSDLQLVQDILRAEQASGIRRGVKIRNSPRFSGPRRDRVRPLNEPVENKSTQDTEREGVFLGETYTVYSDHSSTGGSPPMADKGFLEESCPIQTHETASADLSTSCEGLNSYFEMSSTVESCFRTLSDYDVDINYLSAMSSTVEESAAGTNFNEGDNTVCSLYGLSEIVPDSSVSPSFSMGHSVSAVISSKRASWPVGPIIGRMVNYPHKSRQSCVVPSSATDTDDYNQTTAVPFGSRNTDLSDDSKANLFVVDDRAQFNEMEYARESTERVSCLTMNFSRFGTMSRKCAAEVPSAKLNRTKSLDRMDEVKASDPIMESEAGYPFSVQSYNCLSGLRHPEPTFRPIALRPAFHRSLEDFRRFMEAARGKVSLRDSSLANRDESGELSEQDIREGRYFRARGVDNLDWTRQAETKDVSKENKSLLNKNVRDLSGGLIKKN